MRARVVVPFSGLEEGRTFTYGDELEATRARVERLAARGFVVALPDAEPDGDAAQDAEPDEGARRRSEAARKAAATRKANAARKAARSEAARKAAATRKANASRAATEDGDPAGATTEW